MGRIISQQTMIFSVVLGYFVVFPANAYLVPHPTIGSSFNKIRFAPKQQTKHRFFTHPSKKNDDDDEIFYNDFDDIIGESTPSGETNNDLSRVLKQTSLKELGRSWRLEKNWEVGNWNVRGFMLGQEKIEVCEICVDEEDEESDEIVLGRTDGSICLIRLGTRYLTSFTSRKGDASLVDATTLTENDEVSTPEEGTPFKILLQLDAHPNLPISSLLIDDLTLYTAADSQIRKWEIVPSDDDGDWTADLVRDVTDGQHTGVIHTLKRVSGEKNYLLSVCSNGIFIIWDDLTGEMIRRVQAVDDYGDVVPIASADIDPTDDDTVLYFGLGSGHVLAYSLNNILKDETSPPLHKFLVSAEDDNKPITYIKTLGRVPPKTSRILLTGSASGVLKQWEIFSSGGKLQHWPRLPTQRLSERAHTFASTHTGPIQNIHYLGNILLTCGSDGSILIHSSLTGKKLYSMDGFEGTLKSLVFCLNKSVLVTNGMRGLACLHDFDVEELEEEDDEVGGGTGLDALYDFE